MINPYHVANLEGEWYVLAGTPEHPSPEKYQYSMARIMRARVTKLSFEMPHGFDVKKLLSRTFGRFVSDKDIKTVTIRFDRDVAPLVEKRWWHAQQRFIRRNDGKIDVSFPVSAAGPWPSIIDQR